MICKKCEKEYEDGIVTCEDCNEELIKRKKTFRDGIVYKATMFIIPTLFFISVLVESFKSTPEDLFNKGIENQETPVKSFEYFKESAEQGYAPAQYNLGVYYQYGTGIKIDLNKAFIWYKKSAEQGYPSAQNNLGVAYQFGTGIKIDLNKAFIWYKKSAEQGDTRGLINLGLCYQYGTGTKIDLEKAKKYYQKALSSSNDENEKNNIKEQMKSL